MLFFRVVVVLFALCAGLAQAQSWPARPVRFIVPFPPGGSTDVAARAIADKLTCALGQQFIVDNRAGAGGVIGTAEGARPGQLTYAHPGPGSGQHMTGELLKKMARIDMVGVPYKGGGQAVIDLVGGQVPVCVLGSTPLIPHHKSGRIRIIAFTSKDRFGPMPEIPTLHESGYPGFDSTRWLGLLVPRGTGAEVVQRLHAETVKTLALPEVRERFAAAALQPVGNTPQQFAEVIRAEIERWSRLARELGIRPQ